MKVHRLQFPDIHGFLPSSYVEDMYYAIRSGIFIQILHIKELGDWVWFIVFPIRKIRFFCSIAFLTDRDLQSRSIWQLLRTALDRFTLRSSWCPKQGNWYACGENAIPNTVPLFLHPCAYNTHDWSWNERLLRTHQTEIGKVNIYPVS